MVVSRKVKSLSCPLNTNRDQNAVVVMTMDGYTVGHVPRNTVAKCRVMIENINTLGINLKVSFVEVLENVVVWDDGSRRYLEKQANIKIKSKTARNGTKLRKIPRALSRR